MGLIFCVPMLPGEDPTIDKVRLIQGARTGPPTLTGRNTLSGNGMGIDFSQGGTGARVTWAHSTDYNVTSEATICALVSIGVATQYANYIGKPNTSTHVDPYYDWVLVQDASGSGRPTMRCEAGYAISSSPALTVGVTAHVAGRWGKSLNSGYPEVFINGKVVTAYASSVSKTTDVTGGTQDIRSGVAIDNTSDDSSAEIMGIWVYQRALSDAEIAEHAAVPYRMFDPLHHRWIADLGQPARMRHVHNLFGRPHVGLGHTVA
jgi:hypothetical protein